MLIAGLKKFVRSATSGFTFTTTVQIPPTAPVHLTHQQIQETLPKEEYDRLAGLVAAEEEAELGRHRERLGKLRRELGEAECARI